MFSDNKLYWKFLYFIPVLLVYGIVFLNIYTYTIYYCFEFPIKITKTKIFISLIFYPCAFMTILTHTLAMITNPGEVDQEILKQEKEKNKIKEFSFCKKCDKNRPFKAHHCSTCKKCILKMDHHCPWIGNCVGFYNQKFFYQFLFYAFIGDLFGAIGLIYRIIEPNFVEMLLNPKRKINIRNNLFVEVISSLKDPLLIVCGLGLCIAMAIAIGVLYFYQSYLIANDFTSIDSHCEHKGEDHGRYKKSFKDKIESLKIVLGKNSYAEWFIPTFTAHELNNGYCYANPKN